MTLFIGYILTLAGMLLAVAKSIELQERERERQISQRYIDSIRRSCGVSRERVEAVQRYRHDLAKHIRILDQLLEEGGENTAGRDGGAGEEPQRKRYCRDEILNSIFSIKNQQCAEEEIPFVLQVEQADYGQLRDMDKVGLLYNLMDNAIEANDRIPGGAKKGILLCMRKNGQEIEVLVENQICPGEVVDFETKKEPPENHGIGTKIIDSVIEKYHGQKSVTVDGERHILRQRILLIPESKTTMLSQ